VREDTPKTNMHTERKGIEMKKPQTTNIKREKNVSNRAKQV
jgi:hypothetical protein